MWFFYLKRNYEHITNSALRIPWSRIRNLHRANSTTEFIQESGVGCPEQGKEIP
jgi:hypothetical protein